MVLRRTFILLFVFFVVLHTNAQLLIHGNFVEYEQVTGIDRIIVFEKIDNNSEIHYKAANQNVSVKWYKFSNGVKKEIDNYSFLSKVDTYIDPMPDTGYIVSADGKEIAIWVVEKGSHANTAGYSYQNPSGEKLFHNLPTITSSKSDVNTGHVSFVEDEPGEEPTIGCKITTNTEIRDSINENKRPNATTIEGSAPLHVTFYSNPEGDVMNFLWQIYHDGTLILTRKEENPQYTFSEAGVYKITLLVSNLLSSASDSIEVNVSESSIAVPKIFTPNGDGYNDEFRVAYTSIVEFEATIFNRWGKIVYAWTNPQTGWDGTIRGRPAAEGTYFYYIKAKGSEGKLYKLKGHINLLR